MVLAGLVVCGRCGGPAVRSYSPGGATSAPPSNRPRGADPPVGGGAPLEAAAVAELLPSPRPGRVRPAGGDPGGGRADRARPAQQYADRVPRADYEARLAERQYRAVDPDNRRGGGVGARWEVALRALVEAHEAAQRFARHRPAAARPLLKEQLRDVGRALPGWRASGRLSASQQKALLRSLVRHVIVTRPVPDTIEARIVWVSGAVTPVVVHSPILRGADVQPRRGLRGPSPGAGGGRRPRPRDRLPPTGEGYRSPLRPGSRRLGRRARCAGARSR